MEQLSKAVFFARSIALFATLLIAYPFQAFSQGGIDTAPLVTITTPQGTVIRAELADTVPKRARGLMFRESLPANHGMLFTFSEEQEWSFWMKNTRIPLDIIWMDKTKKVVYVERNVPICTRTDDSCPNYHPTGPALYVLELAAGNADTLKLQRGIRLKFEVLPATQ